MTASNYQACLTETLKWEGGYSNHPADPGGPTNFGITIGDYRRYVKPDATAADVRAMTIAEAKAIYRRRYWDAMRCDELPAGVDHCVFDYAVNSGTGRAPKVVQRCLGIDVSGRMDDATVAAVRKARLAPLIDAICDERMRFLRGLKTWPVFGKGWSRRVAAVRAVAHAMAERGNASAVRAPEPAGSASGKGAVPVNSGAQTTSAGGTIVAGGSAAAQSSDPATIVVIIVATLAVAAGAWLFWRWWQRRQQEARA
jgi:lysozyme family protein